MVLLRRLAQEPGSDLNSEWIKIAANQNSFIQSLDQFCYRPNGQLLIPAEALPELPTDKLRNGEQDSIDTRALGVELEYLRLSYSNLKLRHNALIVSLENNCAEVKKLKASLTKKPS